ncbi:MAG: response regulator [Spirosomataceae bacterium]
MKENQTALKTIFLADDDADDREFFSDALEQSELQVQLTTIKDGVQLMKTLEETVPPPPDVIFLDLNMPRKSGFECLQEIRKTEKLKGIPVVILSTSANADLVEKTYRHGANYYICKPNSITRLKNMIEKVMTFDLRQQGKQPARETFFVSIA